MAKGINKTIVVEEKILRKIVFLRNEKIMLDVHLAEYRNIDRFPEDFMFELSDEEIEMVVSQNVIPHKKFLGGAVPFAFTETGVAMLSSVLKSPSAIEMNIAIMRTFIALRKAAENYKEIMQILSEMRNQYDKQFTDVYKVLDLLIKPPVQPRNKIGFKNYD